MLVVWWSVYTVAAAVGGSAFPAGVAGTSQAILYQRLGFPYEDQWRRVPQATSDHGLPPNTLAASNLPVRDAVIQGRSRALAWHKPPPDAPQPPPGAVVYMDFAGPLTASTPHRFTVYCGAVDAGSGYGRVFPAHGMTAAVAEASASSFIADLGAKMNFNTLFKPAIIRCDQGSAFVAHHFREFLADLQIHQTFSAAYTPQQNSHIERCIHAATEVDWCIV